MTRRIIVDVEWQPEGVYLGTSPDVPGLTVEADTVDEVIDIAADLSPTLLEWHEGRVPEVLTFVTRIAATPSVAAG